MFEKNAGAASLADAARLDILFSRARFVYSVNAVNAVVVAAFLWGTVSSALLLAWAAAMLGMTALRYRMLRDYERDPRRSARTARWQRAAVRGALASGIAWGLAPVLLFPHGSLLHQLFLIVVVIGMMAGSVTSWHACFPVFRAYFLPVAALVLCRLALEIFSGETRTLFAALGITFLVFTAGLYVFARKSSGLLAELLAARYAKEESEDRYRALFRGALAPMLLIDPASGEIVDANDAAAGYYGYSAEQMKRMPVERISALSGAEVAEALAAGQRGGVSSCLSRHRLAGGEVRDVEVHSAPISMERRDLLYAIVHDITERKEAERLLHERDADLNAVLDNLPHLVWLKDAEGRFLAVNRPYLHAAGLSVPSEVKGKTDYDIWPQELAEKYRADDLEVMATRGQKLMEERALHDGRECWMETFKTPIIDDEGRILGTTGYSRDITERKLAEESRKLAASIYQASSEAIMVTDEHNVIVEVNPAFSRITGYALHEAAGRSADMLQSGLHDGEFYRQIWQAVLAEGGWQGEIWGRRKNGELFAQRAGINVIRHPDGSVYRYVMQFSDITERKQKDELIWKQANFDMLTGLPNRRLFGDRLEREIKKSRRTGRSLALLFIDLDRFKEVNDTMGHNAGDQMLVEAAQRISRCVRETDTVARLGGDEFTVILTGFEYRVNIERIAQNILNELGRPFRLAGDTAYVSASIGMTLYPEDAADMESLLKNADQAMYGAKAKGRNRFGYFTESMQREAQEKFALTNDLRLALARGELEVYYQPIVEITSGRVAKAEALLRWKHPERGMIPPDQFIPLAEESGLILEIGEWVFNEAVSSVERWRREFGTVIPVSVNKSPLQFTGRTGGWPERLASRNLPGHSIAVEITEGMLLEELPAVKQRLLVFRDGGIEVSIDDFGTGFSSLAYLRQFDIDYLKIDRSFISSLAENESDQALAEAIIVMAHKLGIRTIAEGVETETQRDLLISFGCDFAQGYLYSRPVPVREFERLLEQNGAFA